MSYERSAVSNGNSLDACRRWLIRNFALLLLLWFLLLLLPWGAALRLRAARHAA